MKQYKLLIQAEHERKIVKPVPAVPVKAVENFSLI